MSKKHFIELADCLREIKARLEESDSTSILHNDPRQLLAEVTRELADFCQRQNSRFQRGLWLAYINGECGPNGGKL